MFRLAITGGIGSGKSVLSRVLRIKGIPVYDTDSKAKILMNEDSELKRELIGEFGPNIYFKDGKLNRQKLADIIFSDKKATDRINSIVHPKVKDDFTKWALMQEMRGVSGVGIESAILFSARFQDVATHIAAVVASEETRISRAMKRDNAQREQIVARIHAQMPQEEISKRSDFVISNDLSDLILPQADEMLRKITSSSL